MRASHESDAPDRSDAPDGGGAVGDPAVERELAAAAAHLQAGRLLKVRRHCQAVLERDPEHPRALRLLGRSLLARNQPAEAVKLLARAAGASGESDGEAAALHGELGDALVQAGRASEALAAYRRALQHGADANLLGRLGAALQQTGDLEAAIRHYRDAIAIAPDTGWLHYNLGTALKRALRFDEAIAAYRQAVTLSPNDPELRQRYGVLLLENGRFADAALAFQAVTRKAPGMVRAHDYLSYCHLKLGERGACLDSARAYVRLAGRKPGPLCSLASALLGCGHAAEALAVSDEILAVAPGDRIALEGKAVALSALGRGEEARALLGLDRLLWVTRVETPQGHASIGEFNRAILEHVRTHPRLHLEMNSLSCHHGSTSDELLVEPKGPVAALESAIYAAGQAWRARAEHAGGHPYLAHLPQRWALSAWTTTLRSQGYQHGHTHPTAWLSGVYYLSLPETMRTASAREAQAGWIEFGRAPYFYACADQGEIRPVQPEEGMLVLFPSYLYHRTLPFESEQPRVTIAFDFRAAQHGARVRPAATA